MLLVIACDLADTYTPSCQHSFILLYTTVYIPLYTPIFSYILLYMLLVVVPYILPSLSRYLADTCTPSRSSTSLEAWGDVQLEQVVRGE